MKEKILKLRQEGKTYNEIINELGCSKSTVSYHCGDGQKEKSIKRVSKRRENVLLAKVDAFKFRKTKNVHEAIRKYQKRDNSSKGKVDKNLVLTFTWKDVLDKFGEEPICYLSGEKLDIYGKEYQLDHIIPSSKNGDNSLGNLGVLHKTVNRMKHDLTPNELIEWCSKILEFNGYTITK